MRSPSADSLYTIRPRGSAVIRDYPLAAFALAGILVGVPLLLFHRPSGRAAFLVVSVVGGVPLVWSTLKSMVRGRFDVDTVAALAITGSVALGEYAAGALIVLMQSGGEALEDYGLRRANRSLDNLLRRAPGIAHLRTDDGYSDIAASEVKVGDLLLVRTGDIVAADGVVVEGCGNVDEAALTGEPVPLPKQPGDSVYSGTINLAGSLIVRTTSTAAQSKYELIVRMVQRAQGERAPINRLANRFTPYFTLLVVVAAVTAWVVTGESIRALSVLVVATPCPLIIATPLAVLSAINRAASLNIITKSGAAIEEAGAIKTLVFDKTGTLTVGAPELTGVRLLSDPAGGSSGQLTTEEGVLALAASVELSSSHILAEAIVRQARSLGIPVQTATEVMEQPGIGVSGRVGDRDIVVGAERYLATQGVTPTDDQKEQRARICETGKTVAFVAADGIAVALLEFEDRVRPEASALLRRLRALGVSRVIMLTGDTQETALAVARQVGIEDVRSRLQPDDKVAAVKALSRQGPVMMVGDGINDAPALASASVGVAMGGHGAGIATDAAHMVITVDNVERVADAIEIGRRMVTVALQGILFGIAASSALMVVAGMGYLPPVAGALAQEALDLVTILNALRAR